MLTIEEARERDVCRICENPYSTKAQTHLTCKEKEYENKDLLTLDQAKRRDVCRVCQNPCGGENYIHFTCGGVADRNKDKNKAYFFQGLEVMLQKDKALRYNTNKPQLRYILHYPRTIELVSRILEGGAAKYEEMNWKKGGNTDESYIDAAMRHLVAFVNGGTFNEDYGTHHLGHCIWNLMTMFELNGHEIMDKKKFDKVIKELTDAKNRSDS